MRYWGFAIAGLALLAGCSTAGSGTASPRPLPPDGMNVAACSDAVCEVSVGSNTAIPLPESAEVKNLKVTAVTADHVTITGEDTGNSSSGTCTGDCDSKDIDGAFTITLGQGSVDTQNGVSVEVKSFDGGRVVLKFGSVS